MKFEERAAGVVVSIASSLNGTSAPDLESTVSAIIDRGHSRIVLDCAGMTYLNSAGVRSLLICAKKCRNASGGLALAALQPACRSILSVTGMLSVLECHDTSEAALAAPTGTSLNPGDRSSSGATGNRMTFIERSSASAVVLSLNGRLHRAAAPDLEARVRAIIKRGDARIVLDCARMGFVSSSGLRALLVCAKACREENGKLVIAALQPHCYSTLNMSGFPAVIDCLDSVEAALQTVT